ncbi:MAG: hypothetical protein L6Q84_10220 [Polyangiaceae bacterium]|nr:hypothetical protein [Polyangiaceae bacterium]
MLSSWVGPLVLGVSLGCVACGSGHPGPGDDEMIVEPGFDGPLGKADSAGGEVELKITLRPDQIGLAKQKFGLRDSVAAERDVWFYDSAGLELFDSGVILRGRSKADASDDSTVKFRPMDAGEVDSEWLALDGFKCEIDRTLAKSVSSCSLTAVQDEGELEDIAEGERDIDKAFSSEQEALLAAYSPIEAEWDALLPLGPVDARVWKVKPKTFDSKLTMELWTLPDSSRFLEVSLRVAPADADDDLAALATYLESRGFDVGAGQETKTRTALEYFAASAH